MATKYEVRTKNLRKAIELLKSQYIPIREEAKTKKKKISVAGITYKEKGKEARTFKNATKLSNFIRKEESKIKKRERKIAETKRLKKERAETEKALKKIKEQAKSLKREAKALGTSKTVQKKKARKLAKAEELQRTVKEYEKVKRIRRERGQKTPGLKSTKTVKTIKGVLAKENAYKFGDRVWGLWELAFNDNKDMHDYRQILYDASLRGDMSLDEIKMLEDLFDEWYKNKDGVDGIDILNDIYVEVVKLVKKYAPDELEKKKSDEEQWS